MDMSTQAYFRDRLIQECEEAKKLIEDMNETGLAVSMKDSIGELSLCDNHPADVASETFERAKDFALRDTAALKVKAIEDALTKMGAGRYGLCDLCNAPIPVERLEAVPYTTMCRRCKEEQEEQKGQRVRPIEEEVLRDPWDHADDSNVMCDREDTWQDVAQHGLSTETEEVEGEGRGSVQDVDSIPYFESNGVYYEDFRAGDRSPQID